MTRYEVPVTADIRNKGSLVEQSVDCLHEFASSAWSSGVTEKINGVKQLCGGKVPQHEQQPELNGAMHLSHIAGQTAGEIAFFLGASKLVGKGIKCAATRGAALEAGESVFAKSLMGQRVADASNFLNKSHLATELATAGATGALAGGVFRPVGNGESQWQRVGNAATEAATFMTLSGVAGKYGGAFTENFAGRMKLNALSGGAAGVVNTNLDALTHGRVASVEDTLMGGAGFAVGNVVTAEAFHGLGKAWQKAGELSGRKAEGGIEGGSETVEREPRLLNMLSMREIADRGDMKTLDRQLKAYYPKLEKAFPLEGEIESIPTYVQYLTDKAGTWEMEQLLGPTIGGLQYQILDVGAPTINKAGWLEHIWLNENERGQGLGIGLFNHLKNKVDTKGGDMTFWEWNNPNKMTRAEMDVDASGGGFTTEQRRDWWRDAGAHVAVDSRGNVAPYGQPSMEKGLPDVRYLSLAFVAPESLAGKQIPVEDYLALCHTAHRTFLGDNWQADPTLVDYTQAARAIQEPYLTLVPMKDLPEFNTVSQPISTQDAHKVE